MLQVPGGGGKLPWLFHYLYFAQTHLLIACFAVNRPRSIHQYSNMALRLLHLVVFSLCPSLHWELSTKCNLKCLQFCPESLGVMLEFINILNVAFGTYHMNIAYQ